MEWLATAVIVAMFAFDIYVTTRAERRFKSLEPRIAELEDFVGGIEVYEIEEIDEKENQA